MLIIGRNPILEALRHSPDSIKKIIIFDNPTDNKINKILGIAEKKNIGVERVSKNNFEKLFDEKNKSEGISQGIIAEAEDFMYADFDRTLTELKDKKQSVVLILDEIQDPHNLGAIIRTASASGADAIIISEKNSAKINHTVIKTSSGAVNYIKICLQSNIYKAIKRLKESNFKVTGTVLNSPDIHYDFDYGSHCAIVFGNEGEGLRKNISSLCDALIKIPVSSKINSLNVSVSAGVILYEILRQNTFKKAIPG